MKKKKFLVGFFAGLQMLLVCPLYSQSDLKIGNEIQIPSTDAWNFVKHGEVNANLYTGTVNVSVPFYVYEDKDFKIPISFDYASNGLVCNMRAGVLGPDWVLKAGGSISVDIRGGSDFSSGSNGRPGFYFFHKLTNPGSEGKLWRYVDFTAQSAGTGMPAPEIIYVPDGSSITSSSPKYDAQPDIFHFNFMGYSGSFQLGWNNQIYVYNTNGDNKLLKVEVEHLLSSNYRIVLTDKAGYKYFFGNDEADKAPNIEGELKLPVSLKLQKILAPNGRTVTFEYTTYMMTTFRPQSFCGTGAHYNFNEENSPHVYSYNATDGAVNECELEGSVLRKMYVDSCLVGELIYEQLPAGTKDQYQRTPSEAMTEFSDCVRLKKISITNPYLENEVIKQADFTYVRTQGARTSYLASVAVSGIGTYAFDYHKVANSPATFPPIGTLSVDHWGYYNGKSSNTYLKIVTTNNTTLDETISNPSRNPDADYAKYGLLQKITYPTGGFSVLDYEPHDYSVAVKRTSASNFLPSFINETGVCGGLRLKSVSDCSETGVEMTKRTFQYTLNGASSGVLLHFPKYWLTYSAGCALNYSEVNINYWSNSLLSYDGSPIEYRCVTQINKDTSKEVYYYSTSKTAPAYEDVVSISRITAEPTPSYGDWQIMSNPVIQNIVAPVSSKAAERGKMIKQEWYKAGTALPEKEVSYDFDISRTLSFSSHPVYLIRKFGYYGIYTDNYRLTGVTDKQNFSGGSVTDTKTMEYNNYGQVASVTRNNSQGQTEITRYEYASDYVASGGIYTTLLERNLLSYPVTEKYFVNIGGTEVQTGGKRYSYALFNNIVKPSKVEIYNSASHVWETETIYNRYDVRGNLLESMDANGIWTSYIWGYGGLYLVAKAENALRSNISSIVGTTPLSGALTAGQRTSIKNACSGASLTCYEYVPMIGVSKIIYPGDQTETYEYNSAGKLKAVYNTEGEITGGILYSTENKQ